MSESAPKAAAPGTIGHFSALFAAQLAYLGARLKLAGIEGKEAAVHIGVLLGMAFGALIIVVFGYFFLVLGLVFLIAMAFENDHAWVWVLLGAAVLHFVGAAALVFIAKGRLGTALFPLTLSELQRDQIWLKSTTTKPS